MNLQEAYKILGLNSSASNDEVKKTFRTLSKKYHPDISKEQNAEAKFKEINEAYQTILNPPQENSMPFTWNTSTNPFNDLFSHLHPNVAQRVNIEDIKLSINISFKESILGADKKITYNRIAPCDTCNGDNRIKLNNGCTHCGGTGVSVSKNGFAVFSQTCGYCKGLVSSKKCENCNDGTMNVESNVSIKIPGGIENNKTLRLGNMGNFYTTGMRKIFSNVLIQVNVDPDPNLTLKNNIVYTNLNISLLEALTGCKKDIPTIYGSKTIDVMPKIKNNNEIILPELGVNKTGEQRVVINVNYPENTEELISFLNESQNEQKELNESE